jgi:exonuclease SbcC
VRIERVTAHAFGPFHGESLDLAPGLTVVSGPNEAGKSSWHAAIRAGICGVRRGRGAATKVEAAFEERHRPWDGDGRWAVEVRLLLDDGRTIEISQDLAGKVACRAIDVVLGRDVSDEIMDGTPDASRWLGLDREAFASTICVGQAQVVAIAGREAAESLQEHMQRAAATRGTDSTAAEARQHLDEFRRAHVGADRQGSRGPLRSAKERSELALATLGEVRARHEAFLDASLSAEAAGAAAEAQARRVDAIAAAIAAASAAELDRRAERAAALAARHPTEPAGSAERDARADAVAAALDGWVARPRPEPLTGATAADLEAELTTLPAPPDGDVEVHPTVVDARRALDRAEDALGLLGPRPSAPPPSGVSEEELRTLARRLRTPDPEWQPGLEDELRAAEADRTGAARGATGWVMAAALAGLGGIAALVAGQVLVAVVGIVVAAGLVGWALLTGRGTAPTDAARVERARAALGPYTFSRDAAREERRVAAELARTAGLPADADELERRADAAAAAVRAAREADTWDARHAELDGRRSVAIAALREALMARGVDGAVEDVVASMADYEASCRRRAERARRAGGREALQRALAIRREAEAAAAETSRVIIRAEDALRTAAADVGVASDGTTDEVAETLAAWRRERSEASERVDDARREWHELMTLLGGRSLEELRSDAVGAATRASNLAARVGAGELAEIATREDLLPLLEIEREELTRARADASTQRGALTEMQRDLPDVAEAEEAVAEAAGELARVLDLGEVLAETTRLLRAAEERVHRDLAPVLSQAITRWLPAVTLGAYTEATVDPADLSIRVKHAETGQWRPPPTQHRHQASVELLSEGTGEQIYLLLRAAMAQHLVTTDETAPLLLDEATVQADAERKQRLLDVLHELSTERQIVLFTHDDDVIGWAARTLDGTRDRLVQLAAAAPAPQPALG